MRNDQTPDTTPDVFERDTVAALFGPPATAVPVLVEGLERLPSPSPVATPPCSMCARMEATRPLELIVYVYRTATKAKLGKVLDEHCVGSFK